MKGVIFNIFEDFVVANWGEEAYEDILDAAKPSCPFFVGPDTYPDDDLFGLVTTACEKHGIDLADAVRAVGVFAFPRLAQKYPVFVKEHSDFKTFMRTVDALIHVEVKKILSGAILPEFELEDPGPHQLIVRYRSPRKLCAFAEGLMTGAAEHFGQVIRYTHGPCMHEGHDHCRFAIELSPQKS